MASMVVSLPQNICPTIQLPLRVRARTAAHHLVGESNSFECKSLYGRDFSRFPTEDIVAAVPTANIGAIL